MKKCFRWENYLNFCFSHTKNKATLLYSAFHTQLAVQILWANRFVECSARKKWIAKLYCQLIKKRRVIKVFLQTANFEFLYIVNIQSGSLEIELAWLYYINIEKVVKLRFNFESCHKLLIQSFKLIIMDLFLDITTFGRQINVSSHQLGNEPLM